ncbi:SDR family oxidoreductase [Williamsia deligens]|uniref:SDR family oxidoreductase n=1 Tax=Williamsia deligens TaxID=321325 RepID=A0ABW3G619_9NOCA|nr:SDR family oxidoreductase [Williamsia deligens]MCP2194169.1 Short-chain dehydrogenase [Williamsia deligens]
MTDQTPIEWRRRTVVNGDVRIAVVEAGVTGAPTVVLVHGWPDTHRLWDHVAPLLAQRFHVVAYDTRGYGDTDSPAGDAPYALAELATDLFAVIDAVGGGAPAHVVAHDWGSVQAWEAVTTPGATDRIASFFSISGPNLDHLGAWAREKLSRPTPAALGQALSQVASSAYTVMFQLPVVPKLFFGALGWAPVWRRFLRAVEGTPTTDVTVAPTLHRDMISGLRYYRANIRPKLFHPQPGSTDVPVFELVNTRDIALRAPIFDGTPRHASRLWRRDLPTGHWLPYSRPQLIAQWAGEFIDTIESGSATPAIERAAVSGPRGPLSGRLTVITGAGSGIGRETAILFARNGSEIVCSDIDAAAARTTAEAIITAGGRAHSYPLDVSDDAAFAAFADEVAANHGVPDIVVNNAGVGLAGNLLDATDAQIRRLVDINLIGVATGSRVFGRKMVAQRAGGHIVNLASAAAFTPQRGLGAYAATKAGVLLLSESLRAELAGHRIGVSAICPGIVDTKIVSTTTFAGSAGADDEKRRQDRMDAAYRRRGYTPDKVARKILAAVLENRAVVPVTPEAAVGYRVYRFVPALSRRMARTELV